MNQRRSVAILFADMKGFSGLPSDKLKADAYSFIRTIVKKVQDNAIFFKPSSNTNIVGNTWGDAIFLADYSVGNLAKIALKMRDEVRQTDWKYHFGVETPIMFRIGLNFGEAEIIMENEQIVDVIGNVVNIAARIEPVAEADSVYATEIFWQMLQSSDNNKIKASKKDITLPKDAGDITAYKLYWDYEQSDDYEKKKIIIDSEQNSELNISVPITKIFSCDAPPNNFYWVGRENELKTLSNAINKVVFITGIGGQGKSGLASQYIETCNNTSKNWEYWDWRDCKEEGNRLHTKIISIIERLTEGKMSFADLKDYEMKDLIELLFKELNNRKIIFVFDNIDSYVEYREDTNDFGITNNVDMLIEYALKLNHSSKFIFTCRPNIARIALGLTTVSLTGLSRQEAKELFAGYKIPMKNEKIEALVETVLEITKGHPLWLNLIAAQGVSGEDNVNKFIQNIQNTLSNNNIVSDLSQNVLKTVWDSLNEKQQTLLRGMGEIVKAETKKDISYILSDELNGNQFNKSFEALNRLNLIVTKTEPYGNEKYYELHPLVKEYVRHKYPIKERAKYIMFFINFYNNLIRVLEPKININQSLNFYENWIAKIELSVNNEDFKLALQTLRQISPALLGSGYVEEYIRISYTVYLNIDWGKAIIEEYAYFHDNFMKYMKTLIEIGRADECKINMNKYGKLVGKRGIHHIYYCEILSYMNWHNQDFDKSISYAEEGKELKETLSVFTNFDIEHSLYLSLRDTRKKDNVLKALAYFSNDNEYKLILENIIDNKKNEYNGAMLGNIGRCLFFIGNFEDSLFFYKVSLNSIFNGNDSDFMMNVGYACFWIGEVLVELNDFENANLFLSYSKIIWNRISPFRAKKVNELIKNILKNNNIKQDIGNYDERDFENCCKKYINS